ASVLQSAFSPLFYPFNSTVAKCLQTRQFEAIFVHQSAFSPHSEGKGGPQVQISGSNWKRLFARVRAPIAPARISNLQRPECSSGFSTLDSDGCRNASWY